MFTANPVTGWVCSKAGRASPSHSLVTESPSFVRTPRGVGMCRQQESQNDKGWKRPLRSSPTMMLLHLIPTPESPGSQSRAHISIPLSQPRLGAALYALKGLADPQGVSNAACASQEPQGTEFPLPQPPHREPSSARSRPSTA